MGSTEKKLVKLQCYRQPAKATKKCFYSSSISTTLWQKTGEGTGTRKGPRETTHPSISRLAAHLSRISADFIAASSSMSSSIPADLATFRP